jgi:hypothetical protein
LAAEISQQFGTDSELIEGDHGIFDIVVDGDKIFSKFDVDRFPEDGEIAGMLSSRSD